MKFKRDRVETVSELVIGVLSDKPRIKDDDNDENGGSIGISVFEEFSVIFMLIRGRRLKAFYGLFEI